MSLRVIAVLLVACFLSLGSRAGAASLSESLGIIDDAPVVNSVIRTAGIETLLNGESLPGSGGVVGASASAASSCGAPTFSCCQAPISCGGRTPVASGSGCVGSLTINITVNINLNLSAACSRPTASACCCTGF